MTLANKSAKGCLEITPALIIVFVIVIYPALIIVFVIVIYLINAIKK